MESPRDIRHIWQARTADPPVREKFNPPKNRPAFPKPYGGLWCSPPIEAGGTAWTEWCISEEFISPPFHLWELIPEKSAKWYVVENVVDLAVLHDRFPGENPFQGSSDDLYWHGKCYDFERMAQVYDAIHLTDEGQWATRFSEPVDFYGWDCASTLWLRWAFDEVIDLGEWSPDKKDQLQS